MKLPGRIYVGDQGTYLAIYTSFDDLYSAVPPSLESTASRVAHVKYSFGKNTRGIDVFRTGRLNSSPSEVSLATTIRGPSQFNGAEIDKKQNIRYEFVSMSQNEREGLVGLIQKDVALFCGSEAKIQTEGDRITETELIIPKTRAKYIEYSESGMLTPGKQAFVEDCVLEANLDFSKGCISGWVPGENGGNFDGMNFTNFFLSPFSECEYCYAKPKHKSFPKTLYKFDGDRLRKELLGEAKLIYGSEEIYGKPIGVMRFGKRTECGDVSMRPQLLSSLEICSDVGTRTVMPTKMLEFDKEVANLLKRTQSVILYSFGFNERETGAVAHNCDNRFRVEQAIKYKNAGVNSSIYLLIHAHASPGKREIEVLETARKHSIPIQLIPERFTSKEVMLRTTGLNWDTAKGTKHASLFEEFHNPFEDSYQISSNGVALPKAINSEWLNLIGKNSEQVRMCHHTNHCCWCGSCFLADGSIKDFNYTSKEKIKKSFDRPKTNPSQGEFKLS